MNGLFINGCFVCLVNGDLINVNLRLGFQMNGLFINGCFVCLVNGDLINELK